MEVEGKKRGVPGMDLVKKVRGHLIHIGTMGTCGERALVQLLTSPRPLFIIRVVSLGPEWMLYC